MSLQSSTSYRGQYVVAKHGQYLNGRLAYTSARGIYLVDVLYSL